MIDRGSMPKKIPYRKLNKPTDPSISNVREEILDLGKASVKKSKKEETNDRDNKERLPKIKYFTKEVQTEVKILESLEVQT